MGDLIPIIEGPAKIRDGKKWKSRFACVTRLSPVADSLTLQLWKDRRDWERNPPTKGSIALEEYLGWEAGFTLDRESNTLALILKSDIISLAFDNRENLIRWQVRVTNQFEEGQHYSAHLIQYPVTSSNNKSKSCSVMPVKVHVQNRRFSMTSGVPPKLVHSWNINDLRRFGSLEGGRFCFEGGSRCGKGEGIHILRLDDPNELQKAFEAAANCKLESKRKSVMYKCSNNGSFGSHLDCIGGVSSAQSVLSVASGSRILSHADSSEFSSGTESTMALIQKRSQSRDELRGQRSVSRCRNPSVNWSSNEGSIETMSLAISEMTGTDLTQHQILPPSPEHLVNRKDLLEKMGIESGRSQSRASRNRMKSQQQSKEFAPQWSMDLNQSQESNEFPNYDVPKHAVVSPTKKIQGLTEKRMVAATPCACDGGQPFNPIAYENYDIPKHVSQDGLQFYDTPRNLLNEVVTKTPPASAAYGNYDTPQQPLPVYRKPCGCIMKLVKLNNNQDSSAGSKDQDALLWAYFENGNAPNKAEMPRVKLTGTGKMPVVDMRNVQNNSKVVTGLPPKSPVYALINKKTKKSPTKIQLPAPNPTHMHNYCNVSPLLGDIINKKPELFEQVQPDQVYASVVKPKVQQNGHEYENTKQVLEALKEQQSNYLPMGPGSFEKDLPVVAFDPIDYRDPRRVQDDPVDPISLRLQELSDALEDSSDTFAELLNPGDNHFNLSDLGLLQNLPPPPPELLKPAKSPCAKYLSQENLPIHEDDKAHKRSATNGFDTMPKATTSGGSIKPLFMRRSSSVPCKTTGSQGNRGSTSSSDSGFSPGSPNNGQCMPTK